jgi:predicted O-methyltransferase YrrM
MHSWLRDHCLRETEVQRQLRLSMENHPEGEMLTSPEQVQLMALLAKSIGTKRAVEVGVFTGYSALGIARILPVGGKLYACDMSAEFMAIAREWWEQAGESAKIESRIGTGEESLNLLLKEGLAGSIDFMYVDADKVNSWTGGMIGMDNMFLGGNVADSENNEPNTLATRELARKLLVDDRVDYSLLPIGDGLGLAMKR